MINGVLNINQTIVNGTLSWEGETTSGTVQVSVPVVMDIQNPGSKLNKWVIGKGIPGIASGGSFLGYSTVEDPTTEDDFSPILAAT